MVFWNMAPFGLFGLVRLGWVHTRIHDETNDLRSTGHEVRPIADRR